MSTFTVTRRLTPRQATLLRAALKAHLATLMEARARGAAWRTRTLIASLPRAMPYDVTLSPEDWAIVSKALRPCGSRPEPGSAPARWLALYQTLRGAGYFYGMRRPSPRLAREREQRALAAKKALSRGTDVPQPHTTLRDMWRKLTGQDL